MVDIDALVVELAKQYLPSGRRRVRGSSRTRDPRRRAGVHARERRTLRRHSLGSHRAAGRFAEQSAFSTMRSSLIKSRLVEGGIYALQASTASVHNAALHCKMARTLRRHYAHVVTFTRTCRPSTRNGPFSTCSDRVDLAGLIRDGSTPIALACAARAFFTTRSRTAASSRCRFYLTRECWPPAGIPFKTERRRRSAIDYSHAPHAWEKEKSNFVALLDLKLESVEHGRAVMRMPYRPEITNGTGAVMAAQSSALRHGLLRRARLDLWPRSGDDDRRAAV